MNPVYNTADLGWRFHYFVLSCKEDSLLLDPNQTTVANAVRNQIQQYMMAEKIPDYVSFQAMTFLRQPSRPNPWLLFPPTAGTGPNQRNLPPK